MREHHPIHEGTDTMTDDQILAAARDAGFQFDHAGGSYGMIHGFSEDVEDLYRAAYSAGRLAGMEEAANIARWYAAHADVVGHPLSMAAIDRAVDAIRAAAGREAKA